MACCLQTLSQNSSDLFHQLIAQFRVLLAFFAHVRRAKKFCNHWADGDGIEFPPVGLKKPRQSQQLTGANLLNQDCLLIGEFVFETDLTLLDQVKSIRGLMFAKD